MLAQLESTNDRKKLVTKLREKTKKETAELMAEYTIAMKCSAKLASYYVNSAIMPNCQAISDYYKMEMQNLKERLPVIKDAKTRAVINEKIDNLKAI